MEAQIYITSYYEKHKLNNFWFQCCHFFKPSCIDWSDNDWY